MSKLTLIVTGAALLAASALFGAALYDAVVLAPNFGVAEFLSGRGQRCPA